MTSSSCVKSSHLHAIMLWDKRVQCSLCLTHIKIWRTKLNSITWEHPVNCQITVLFFYLYLVKIYSGEIYEQHLSLFSLERHSMISHNQMHAQCNRPRLYRNHWLQAVLNMEKNFIKSVHLPRPTTRHVGVFHVYPSF